MTRLTFIAIAVCISCALPVSAFSQDSASTSSTPTASTSTTATTKKSFPIRTNYIDTKITAKVVELDMANRRATFFTASKEFVTIRVPKKLHNFDHVKIGDMLTVHYTIAAAARLNPGIKDGIRETIETSSPTATHNKVEVLANIQSVDTSARTVTIQGATRTVTISVPEGFDMGKLKMGDQVQAEFSEAVAVDIELAPATEK